MRDGKRMTAPSHWDAVVVGTGFGGSTVALQLARAGVKVLVLERGRWVDRDETAWDPMAIHIDRRYKGTTPYKIAARGKHKLTYPDDTVGGKSIFYGAASFRLRREDFCPTEGLDGTDRSARPPGDWPIRYDDLEPFYDAAERIIGVAGVVRVDPTEPPRRSEYPTKPPPYGTSAQRIAEAATDLGLRPFPIPLAINFQGDHGRPRCIMCMTCDMFPCKICAKNDLAVTLLPQAKRHGAQIRDRTVATQLVTEGRRVRKVECRNLKTGETYSVTCDLCVLSGGAIASAALLLASDLNEIEPNGRLIGRYLMCHCSGIVIGIFPFKTNPERQFHKQVAITDFYFGHPKKPRWGWWGMIQALQTQPPELMEQISPYPAALNVIAGRTVPYHAYLLCIAHELPNFENRVDLDPTATDAWGMPLARVSHTYARHDLRARRALYREAARILRRAGSLMRVRMPIHSYSHAIGTCRFGTNADEAVLDPWCGFFGVPNLFVVDGSFFPSSGGVNPSLTIAANGLRVGRHIVDHWGQLATATTR